MLAHGPELLGPSGLPYVWASWVGGNLFGSGKGVVHRFCQSLLVPGPLDSFKEGTQMVGPLEPHGLVMNKDRGTKQLTNRKSNL